MLTVEIKRGGAKGHWGKVATLRDAVAACRDYIVTYNLGNSAWQGGLVRLNGKRKFWISYNGRVWLYEPKGWSTSTPEITGEELDKLL